MATDNKYDRQIRLWGANGQKALCESNILLVNGDSAGTETLKNLVLPGVGSFTVLDEHILREADLGSNFFVTAAALGRPRAEIITELLCEMNPDVTGAALHGNLSSALVTNPNFLHAFTMVVASNLPEAHLLQLSEACWQRNLPLVVTRAYGLIGYVRLQTQSHHVLESKPDGQTAPVVWDLRMAQLFPELAAYCGGIDFAGLDMRTHAHVPYLVILVKALGIWRTQSGASAEALPKSKDEKEAFLAAIRAISDANPPVDYPDEQTRENGKTRADWPGAKEQDNFQEALKEAYRVYSPPRLPGELADLMESEAAARASAAPAGASDVQVLAWALRAFMAAHGGAAVPLGGQIPDMLASTDLFVALQTAFQQRASADKAAFTALCDADCAALGRPPVSPEVLETFCKNVFHYRRVDTRSIAAEHASPDVDNVLAALQDGADLPDPLQAPILWYLALRAADRYCNTHGCWPGSGTDGGGSGANSEAAVDEVWAEMQALATECAGGDASALTSLSRAHAVEIVRYGGCDIHNIGAIVGGIASQEAVKLITHQYVPINNTYLFNGLACVGKVYEL